MMLPFQCVLYCDRIGRSSLIIAASGDCIHSFSASTGTLLSSWSENRGSSNAAQRARKHTSGSANCEAASDERPVKRRRPSGSAEVSDSTSAEIVIDNESKKPRKRKPKIALSSAVTNIIVDSTGKHIVAITGEDKCIRVLEVLPDDTLREISERFMPKRPCSVTLTTDESMILCADKFGDVYALPLFIPLNDQEDVMNEHPMALGQSKQEAKSKPFIPAATELTVHTKRNQQALKNQQSVTSKTSQKNSLDFAHQLLLGHVSLLTDLAYVTVVTAGSVPPFSRSYLLTSDRDEHIRVSRGLPQAHVIEGYCLGHTEFVSRLCVPLWDRNCLVSGGGDDYLLVWKWLSSEVQQRVELKSLVTKFRERTVQEPRRGIEKSTNLPDTSGVAVTGIWTIQASSGNEEKHDGYIVVACERVPALVIYSWHEDGKVEHQATLGVEGNILDVAIIPKSMCILYTIDNLEDYSPVTVNQIQRDLPSFGSYCYSISDRSWVKDSPIQGSINSINEWATMYETSAADLEFRRNSLREHLYNTEKLRKRGQGED